MKNILNYILGYVSIIIKGEGIERFINYAAQRDIHIWDLHWQKDNTVHGRVQLSHVKALRHVARKSRCSFKVVSRRGLPFKVKGLQKRKAFVFGGLMFVCALYILTSFIFFIEVTSQEPTKGVHPRLIKKIAAEKGVVIGRPKWLMDYKETEKHLLNKIPQLTWVAVRAKGIKLEIEYVEKVLPDPGEKDKSLGNVIAFKDGVITQILVLQGEAQVVPGDTVSKGDILIKGEIFTDETLFDEAQFVRADGIVRAKVWYRAYGESPAREKVKSLTGKKTRYLSLFWGKKQIMSWGPSKSPYSISTRKTTTKTLKEDDKGLPTLQLLTRTYWEEEITIKDWGSEGAWSQAVEKALMIVRRQLPLDAKIVKKDIRALGGKEKELQRALVVIETEEEIGKFLPIEK